MTPRLFSLRAAACAAALLALGGIGCTSIVGDQDADTKFLVKPSGDGHFAGWSQITIEDDTSGVNSATLQFVTLERLDDPSAGDLTFIQSIEGAAAESHTLVAKKEGMPPGEHSVPLDVVYTDNLKPLFPDGHTIKIDWDGAATTSSLPADGVWIRVRVRVHIE